MYIEHVLRKYSMQTGRICLKCKCVSTGKAYRDGGGFGIISHKVVPTNGGRHFEFLAVSDSPGPEAIDIRCLNVRKPKH